MGFLLTVVDIMVIWIKFTNSLPFSSLIPKMLIFTFAISCLFRRKWKLFSHDWLFLDYKRLMDYTVHGILQARRPFPSPGNIPNPGIEPRSHILWADSLPAEPQGKTCLTMSRLSQFMDLTFHSTSQLFKSIPQPLIPKKLKLISSMKTS